MSEYRMVIGAERRSGRADEIRSPYDGSLVGLAHAGRWEDLDAAIDAAVGALDAARRTPAHRRASILRAIAGGIQARAADLARLIALEGGKPIRFAEGEVLRAISTFSLAADEALRMAGEVVPMDTSPSGEGRLALTRRVPRGVVAGIAPFNFPLNLVAQKVAPAIAAGCTIVLKPAPQTPLTAHVLADIATEAGLSPGVLNVVHCDPAVAQRMVEDGRVAVLSFTGSDAVGWRLRDLAHKKAVLLELGGNAPVIIDEGVDLSAIMGRVVIAAFAHAGQVCIKAQRFFVHRALWGSFVDGFVSATRAVRRGDPLDPATVVGPLIGPEHVERIRAWVSEAVAAGARVLCGGGAEGNVVEPTVLVDVPDDAKVCAREVFGPVAVLAPVDTFDEALVRANATRYGLQAGVFTPRLDHALRAFDELRYGGVIINDVPTFRVDNMPYGGTGDSGLGREGVRYAIEELTEPRLLVI
ncbi:MAG: aldehyde dehydrogenase [Myxococcales bacterium]